MTPTTAEHWRQLGVAESARGRHQAAVEAFARAFALAPGDADLRSRLALEQLTLGDVAGARREALAVGEMAGAGPKALDRAGHVLGRTQALAQSVAFFRRAAQAAPGDPAILRNLAWGAQYVGAFDEAQDALRRALAVAPDDAMAWFNLSGLPGWAPTDCDLAMLERLATTAGNDVERGLAAGHALARALEARGDYPSALAALTRAKAARRRATPYDVNADLALFEAAVKAWETGPRRQGDPSQAPIFVVGPPRSGTTLLDRILASHPLVASAGEPTIMPALALTAAGLPATAPLTAEVLTRGAAGPAGPMGAAYLQAAAVLTGSSARFIDKRPFNLILAGMISRILPNARILRMRRDPADTVVGNYRQFFNLRSRFHGYSYDLVDTARYVAGMEQLSEAWGERLPADRYRVIDYPDLVADPEGQIRAALDFCGLPWDPACLEFHNNADAVSTASAVQVREPLHGRNLDVAQRYGDGLEPALAVLRQAGRR